MIALLLKLVEVLQGGAERLSKFRRASRREEVLLDLLTSYFILLDIGDCGSELIELGGEDPVQRVSSLSENAAHDWVMKCRSLLWRQRNNLHRLGEILLYKGLPILDVLDAGLLHQLAATIGSKASGLFYLGAVLEMHFLWGAMPEQAEVELYGEELATYRNSASLIETLLSTDGTSGGIERAIRDLNELKENAERLRTHVVGLCSADDLMELSARAKLRAHRESRLRRPEELGPMIGPDDAL
jgi:hypothetical protein